MPTIGPGVTSIRQNFEDWDLPLPAGGIWALPRNLHDFTSPVAEIGTRAEDAPLGALVTQELYLASGEASRHAELAGALAEWSRKISEMSLYSSNPEETVSIRRRFCATFPHRYASLLSDEEFDALISRLGERALKAFRPYRESVLEGLISSMDPGTDVASGIPTYSPTRTLGARRRIEALDMGTLCLGSLFPHVLGDFNATDYLVSGVFLFPGRFMSTSVSEFIEKNFGLYIMDWAEARPGDGPEFFETLKVFASEMKFPEAVEAARAI